MSKVQKHMFHKITEGLSLITKECAKNINKVNFF